MQEVTIMKTQGAKMPRQTHNHWYGRLGTYPSCY